MFFSYLSVFIVFCKPSSEMTISKPAIKFAYRIIAFYLPFSNFIIKFYFEF